MCREEDCVKVTVEVYHNQKYNNGKCELVQTCEWGQTIRSSKDLIQFDDEDMKILSRKVKQQLLLRQEITISQILGTNGKQFRRIRSQYSDGNNGRCAMGVIMSYFGWDGSESFETVNSLLAAADMLKQSGIDEDLLIDLNDSGYSFDEIADYLDGWNA